MTPRDQQIQALLAHGGFAGATFAPLAGDASFRRYVRVTGAHKSAMLMDAPPDKEDVRPYITIARYMHGRGCSVPAILGADEANGLVLLEDLGDDTFTRVLAKENGKDTLLYEKAIDVLAEWHDARRGFSNRQALALPIYDEALLLRETQLFADWYMPQVMGMAQARALGAEYVELWRQIIAAAPLAHDQFVHRDYHADNLIWLPQREGSQQVGLLDFQDAVYGDAAYDLVSLLEDARRDVPPALADAMLKRYLAASKTDATRFLTAYAVLGAQRNSKIIGIFARLAARDGKQHYLSYLPRVWSHMQQDLKHPAMVSLKNWLDIHIKPEWRGAITLRHNAEELVRFACA